MGKKMMKTTALIICVAAMILVTSALNAAPFGNGDFENFTGDWWSGYNEVNNPNGVTGWTCYSIGNQGTPWGCSHADWDSYQMQGGTKGVSGANNHCVALRWVYSGGIKQAFDTVVGHTYQISYWVSGDIYYNAQSYSTTPTIRNYRVTAGSTVQDLTYDTAGNTVINMNWVQRFVTFTAVSDQTTLSFENTGSQQWCGNAAFIDNVTVTDLGITAAGEVLKYRLTTTTQRVYCFQKFSNAARTIQPGDYIEYDVYLNYSSPGLGGMDIKNTDGTYWRDLGCYDQNGLNIHPAENLVSRAYHKWYHRKLAVPAAVIGKTTQWWDVAIDGTFNNWECLSAVYDNVRITNGGTTVLNVYTDGAPSLNQLDFSNGATYQSADLLYGPMRQAGIQVAADFFFWYDAPNNKANASQMVVDPHGLLSSPWSGYGSNGYYSSKNVDWWEAEFQDMKRAGVDIAPIVCWGNLFAATEPWFTIPVLSNYMVPALERSGCGIKIALFDDTTSEVSQWNYDNGRGGVTDPPMPLSDSANWAYFYDLKIKPFFLAIPQKFWATHNGLSLEQGGRPIIYTYASAWYTDVDTYGTSMWSSIKSSFARDFKDANGNGITPFIIHEYSWASQGGGCSADSSYTWGGAFYGPNIQQVGGYYNCEIGPGYDDRLIRSPGNYTDRQRQQTLTNWYNGTYGGRRVWEVNMLTMETWNELWEGTAIDRCVDYPDPWSPGTYLPETFYMDTFHNLVQSSIGIRDNDATFLRTWEIPASVSTASNSITVNVRNDGALPWEPGTHFLGGRLLNSTTKAVVTGTERSLAGVPSEVLGGGECQMTFSVPSDWPDGSYILQLDMMQGSTWFSSFGDTPVAKSITLDRTAPTGSLTINSGATYTNSTSVTLILSATDTGSGVSQMHFANVGSSWNAWRPYATSTLWVLPSGDGSKFVYVQFKDAAGNVSSVVSDSIILDATPPSTPGTPTDVGAYTNSTSITFSWTAVTDALSGFAGYRCYIGTVPYGSGTFSGYVGNVLSKTITGSPGTTYYCCVQAKDNAGNWSATSGSSDGIIMVEYPGIDISTAKALSEMKSVGLAAVPVTAVFADRFYAEDPNRSSGIMVKPASGIPSGLAVGNLVDVGGVVKTDSDYVRWLDATVSRRTGTQFINPLGMVVSRVGGGSWQYGVSPLRGQIGVSDGFGLNNIGLLICTWGRVSSNDSGSFKVNDGSGNEVKVVVSGGALVPDVGKYVAVTGISSCYVDSGRICRLLLVRGADDIVSIQ